MNNIQINGQRRWGPPESWSGPPPPHGTEVFIKNIPEQVFELELYATFSAAGVIYEVRLPVNWDGLNRGYAFVRFTTVRAADEAIETFDGYEIRRNRKIKVARSVDNTRLFLSAVPIDKNAEDLKRDLSNYVENVKKVYVYPTLENRSLFRGYAFVEFETHRDAAIAKRVLTPDVCYGLFEKKCVAAWANPLPYLDRSLLKSLNVLFMRNIPKDIKSFHLKKAIENLTGGEEVRRVKKMNNFAFLTFKDHKSAERALYQLQSIPFLISDHETQVEWAIPREVVASSFSTPDKECEASVITVKGCDATMSVRGRSVSREELRSTNRLQNFSTFSQHNVNQRGFSKSPDLLLSSPNELIPHINSLDNARIIESESATSVFSQSGQREIRNKMEPLQSKTGLSLCSITATSGEKDSRKAEKNLSDSAAPNTLAINKAFQHPAGKRTCFLSLSDTPFDDISCSSFGSLEITENGNLRGVTCGEESDCGSDDNFLHATHSDTSPYSSLSPSAMTSPSVESSVCSPFSVGAHSLFSQSVFEEIFLRKPKPHGTDPNADCFRKEGAQNEQSGLSRKLVSSVSGGIGVDTSSSLASCSALENTCQHFSN